MLQTYALFAQDQYDTRSRYSANEDQCRAVIGIILVYLDSTAWELNYDLLLYWALIPRAKF